MRLLTTLAVAALASATTAQTGAIAVDSVTHIGTYRVATGELVRDSAPSSYSAALVYDNTAFQGSFFTPGPGVKNHDWGDLSATGQNEIVEVSIGYATSSTTPIDLNLYFYEASTGNGVQGTEVASFGLTGLDPSPDGNPAGFSVDVDLTGFEFDLADGPIGYAYEVLDSVTGPLLVGPPNPTGVENLFDQYDLADTYLGTFQFTGGSPFASFWMGITGQQAALTPSAPARLLLSEFATTPTDGEFVEIFNPNSFPVDLTDVYLTDATFANGNVFYYQIVEGGGGGGGFGDWFARFPAGASIGPGEYQTIALNGSTAFNTEWGVDPTYEIAEDDASPDAIPEMLEATPGSIGGLQAGLTNFGEVVVLFYWDGQTDLVQDLDYVVYGDKAEAIDKTGVSIDGPDADLDTSTYADDTSVALQDGDVAGATGTHAIGDSWQRLHLSEGTERHGGFNGLTGNDETNENVSFTWTEGVGTPNAETAGAVSLRIDPGAIGPGVVQLRGATPNSMVFLLASLGEDLVTVGKCPGEGLRIDLSTFLIEGYMTDANGDLDLPVTLTAEPLDVEVLLQGVDLTGCVWSNLNATNL